jgi:hypothetical protein
MLTFGVGGFQIQQFDSNGVLVPEHHIRMPWGSVQSFSVEDARKEKEGGMIIESSGDDENNKEEKGIVTDENDKENKDDDDDENNNTTSTIATIEDEIKEDEAFIKNGLL